MAGFLYYLPGKDRGVKRSEIEEAGLSHAFDEGRHTPVGVQHGPDDGAGVVIADDRHLPANRIGYYPDRQAWTEATQGKHWIGYETDARPGPADLIRQEPIDGHRVALGDGNEWLVAVARSFPSGRPPEEALTLGPGGEIVREPLARYAAVSRQAERVWRQIATVNGWEAFDDLEPLSDEECFRVAVEALSLNYRVGPAEVSVLRLLTTRTVSLALQAFVDGPVIEQVLEELVKAESKKNAADTPAGGSTSDGKPDG